MRVFPTKGQQLLQLFLRIANELKADRVSVLCVHTGEVMLQSRVLQIRMYWTACDLHRQNSGVELLEVQHPQGLASLDKRKLTAFAVLYRELRPFVVFRVEKQHIHLVPHSHQSREPNLPLLRMHVQCCSRLRTNEAQSSHKKQRAVVLPRVQALWNHVVRYVPA